jgi:hypothetical protein
MTNVKLNGQPLDTVGKVYNGVVFEGIQSINKDLLNIMAFTVETPAGMATYEVQLLVDVKVPATKLTVKGNNGEQWDLDPSPGVSNPYDMSDYYRNDEGIWEKLLYLNVDRSISSVELLVEAPDEYHITQPGGSQAIVAGLNMFRVTTSHGIHKMDYNIIVDRDFLVDLNVAYMAQDSGDQQIIPVTEQERHYGENTDTLVYIVPANSESVRIGVNNQSEDISVTGNIGTFDLTDSDMIFHVTGEARNTHEENHIFVRVLKNSISLRNFTVTVNKKSNNSAVPICVFPESSLGEDTYMCIVPESDFEERILHIAIECQNTEGIEVEAFRIGNVLHDERYGFIEAMPDTLHRMLDHQYNIQNALRTDNFYMASEVETHRISYQKGHLNYKTEKQLDGYYYLNI